MNQKHRYTLKFTRKNILLFCLIFFVVVLIIYYFYLRSTELTFFNYHGKLIQFRASLKEADTISVHPSEKEIYDVFMNTHVKNVTIAFKPASEKENVYYELESIEIVNKMVLAYRELGFIPNSFDGKILDDYENVSGTSENPVIALVHPVYSDETVIRKEGYVTFIKAKDNRDFDLVTVKFLMIVMGIEI